MCGIAGIISSHDTPDARQTAVERMCRSMLHRGPDDHGLVTGAEATLGMQRLAIFDPAHGHQPMSTPDGRFTLVFNGAIYNHLDLRKTLEGKGVYFRTHCDTEVLLYALAEWGDDALRRLRGMYAFALWDIREGRLFCARDPLGIKPLYYQHKHHRFVFASEINALRASGVVETPISAAGVSAYLSYFAVPAPGSIYEGITCLRPGECLTWQYDKIEVRTFWNLGRSYVGAPPAPSPVIAGSRKEFVAGLREKLEDTLRAHALADVPVGAFLSGGLDSSAIVALMSKLTGTRIRTFSVIFDEARYSEAGPAAESADYIRTDHHPFVLTGARVAADIDTLLATLDQPTGDGINTYYASQAARAGGVTVALSGLGSDELLGGYRSFWQVPRLRHALCIWKDLPGSWQRFLLKRLRQGNTQAQKLADFLLHARSFHELAALQRRVLSESARNSLLAVPTPFVAHPELARLKATLGDASRFKTISAYEIHTYMTDVLLRDSDVMSMRHSLEVRVPFVDVPFIEWLWAQPDAFKSDSRYPKSALADALGELIPPSIRYRQKQGFTLPFAVWMRKELHPFLSDTFTAASIGRSGLFNVAAVERFWQGFNRGNDSREWSRVWSLAILIAFINRRSGPTLA